MAKVKYRGTTYSLPNLKLYRNGIWQPRWEPSPTLRRKGWKGKAFKDEQGEWLSLPDLIRAAQNHIEAVENWRSDHSKHGQPSQGKVTETPPRHIPGSFAELFHDYQISRDFRTLRDRTQSNYRYSIRFLNRVLAHDRVESLSRAKAKKFYQKLADDKGLHVAKAHMQVLGTIIEWAFDAERIPHNPLTRLKKEDPEPRVRFLPPEEIDALVNAADKMGMPSIGDLIIAGVNTGQRRADIFKFPINLPTLDTYSFIQGKSRRKGNKVGKRITLPTAILNDIRPRMKQAAERAKLLSDAHPTLIFINESTKRDYIKSGSHFNRMYRLIRDEAAKSCPTLLGDPEQRGLEANFQDLRDTALTRMVMAKISLAGVCSIIGHDEKSALATWKHYLAYRPEIAENAGDKLIDWKTANNIIW